MTVKELKELLDNYPDDAKLYLTEDFYGNADREVDEVAYSKMIARPYTFPPHYVEVLCIK